MKRNIYKLVSSVKQGLFALALTLFLGTAYSQTTYTFNYTGTVQTITLPAGNYQLECWGADGGSTAWKSGGKGGYSKGVLTLLSAQTVSVYVAETGHTNSSVTTPPSFGGGGSVGAYNPSYAGNGASGGGASDVRVLVDDLYHRIIVGGGGGGANSYGNGSATYSGNGGDGGGVNGANGLPGTGTTYGPGFGGTQTTGGAIGIGAAGSTPGIFGAGGSCTIVLVGTGGGGGWYGGGASYAGGGAGGGSGYVLTANSFKPSGYFSQNPSYYLANDVTAGMSDLGFVAKPIVTGNGLVLIKELCNIALSITGANSSSAICAGQTVTLTTNAVSNYSWSNGATTSSIVVSPAITTGYSLTATSSSNCVASNALSLVVNTIVPTLTVANTASASGGICPNSTVNLTASGAITYSWTGATPTITNGVTFGPLTGGSYTVVGTNGCGTGSAVTSISVHPLPTVIPATSASSLCSGNNLTLTATGNATAYAWVGGYTSGVGFQPAITATYTTIGTSALSCTASATIPVTVVPTPNIPPAATSTLICIGGSATLSAGGATNYTWTSTTQTLNTSSMIVTPPVGVAVYTITKSNANCVVTQTISVRTNSLPTLFAIVNPTIVCSLNTATLAIAGGQTYTWTAPGPPSYTFTGASPIVSPLVSTTYSVAASDGTCISTTTLFLPTNPNPTITATASSPSICYGQSVTVNATGGLTYTWTANTSTFNTQSVTDTPTTSISYNVVGDNSFGCSAAASAIVLVNPNPTITIAVSKPLVCSGGATTFTANGAATYSWDANANNALTQITTVNPVSLTTGIMIYTVQGTNSFNCQSSKTVQVSIFVPSLTVTGNTNTCAGGAVNLTATGGNINSYSWFTTVGGAPLNFSSITTTLGAAAVFTVNATTTSLSVNCPATQTVALGIYYNPTITAVAQRTTICTKESVELYAGGGASYAWNNGMIGGTITVSPNTQTTYTVTGTDANGCVSTGTVQVKLSGCVGISELHNMNSGLIIYPNPNNGEFKVQSASDLKLSLVNELGQLIEVIELSATNNYQVSVTDLAKGIYFMTGQKNNVQINQKIVVTK